MKAALLLAVAAAWIQAAPALVRDAAGRRGARRVPLGAVLRGDPEGAPPCAAAQKDTISYTHVTPRVGFIAVYAGDTEQAMLVYP